MRQSIFFLLAIAFSTAFLSACNQGKDSSQLLSSENRLDLIKNRKKLICGVDGKLPGFSLKDEEGNYSGFDTDICRAVAAALFNDPEAVDYKELNPNQRFTAVAFGDVDMLSRNSTWTLTRDASFKINFSSVLLYDGQSVMVRTDSGIKSLEDLNNKSVCVTTGTTTELNLYDDMNQRGINYNPIKFLDNYNTFNAYLQKRCQAVTFDRSQLFTRKSSLTNPAEHIILEETISKEPLAPAVSENDPRWFEAIKWITYALIEAEELGINQANLEQMKKSENPKIRRFLGLEGDLGQNLGLPKEFTQYIISHVGNYGEIYERNLGNKSPYNIPRGLNALWKNGGLLYSPPFR
jgi:general L-amino acid transport system substrate-binding protein